MHVGVIEGRLDLEPIMRVAPAAGGDGCPPDNSTDKPLRIALGVTPQPKYYLRNQSRCY